MKKSLPLFFMIALGAATPVTAQVQCQPPAKSATQATSGGPRNWPQAEHCCTQPIVVDTICSPGATLTARANKVAGIIPPTAENVTTATKRRIAPSPAKGLNATTEAIAVPIKPSAKRRCVRQPARIKRPAPRFPTTLAAQASAVNAPAATPLTPACM